MTFDDLIAAAERLAFLCHHTPSCPSCATDQVQIVDRAIPAGWRCRRCRHPFTYEPA